MASPLEGDVDVLEEGGVRKVRLTANANDAPCRCTLQTSRARVLQAICGYTWPGIEYGEPPSCAYTFFEARHFDRSFYLVS